MTLPTISAPSLAQSHAGEVPFSLVVSGANCTNGKLVSLWIDHTGSPAVTPQGTLRNASSNTNRAEGVEIELLNAANGNKINLAMNTPLDDNSGDVLDANNQPVATIVNNTAALNYIARYYMPGSVTPGVIYTYISFTMQYN